MSIVRRGSIADTPVFDPLIRADNCGLVGRLHSYLNFFVLIT